METDWKWCYHMARCTKFGIVSQLESVVADLPTSASARLPEVRAAIGGRTRDRGSALGFGEDTVPRGFALEWRIATSGPNRVPYKGLTKWTIQCANGYELVMSVTCGARS